MYAKLIEGQLQLAPSTLTVDMLVHYHPPAELYAATGFFPVVDTPAPEQDENDPKYYTYAWENRDGAIVKVWDEATPPEPVVPAPTTEDRLVALENRVSSVETSITNTELALVEVYEAMEV